MLLALSTSSIVLCQDDSEALSVELIKSLSSTDAGIDGLMSMLSKDGESLRSSKPFYFFYLNALKSMLIESDFLSADKQFRFALEEADKNNNPKEQALAIKGIIDVNTLYGDIAILIDYGSMLLELGEKTNQPDMFISGAYSIAWGHYFIYDDKKVVEYLELGAAKARETDNQMELAQFHNLMARLYDSQSNIYLAKKSYASAEEILKTLDQRDRRVRIMSIRASAGKLLVDGVQGKQSDDMLQQLDDLILQAENEIKYSKELLISLYGWKADTLKDINMISEAIESYEKLLEEGDSIRHIKNGIDPYQFYRLKLADAYYIKGEYKKSAGIYNAHSTAWNGTNTVEQNENSITKVKGLAEQQLNEKIEILDRLKKTDEEKIKMQENALAASIVFIAMLIIGFIFIGLEHKRILSLKKTIYIQSITDDLTQIYNRGKIIEVMENELVEDNVVAIIDIDDFKNINDMYGHAVGDEVIVSIVDTIKKSLRSTDILGRYGGEEFILILKQTDSEDALNIIERVRKDVESIQWSHKDLKTTISIGMMKKCHLNADKLFVAVDGLLYEAKRSGKNCVIYRDCLS